MTTVALGILCHDRSRELDEALRSSVDQGFDEVIVVDVASDPPLIPRPDVTWLRLDQNVGPVGRNHLVEHTTADIVAFLDDDAVFLSHDVADRLRDHFLDRKCGAVAFRITRVGGVTESSEHPFRGAREPERSRPCAYFVGAGNAVRRDAWITAGGMDPRYFYSTEEIDLALSLARLGWGCVYDASIRVEHRPSSRGRSSQSQVVGFRLRNRIWLVRRHLPWPLAAVHLGAWAARTLAEAIRARDLMPWIRAWQQGLSDPVTRYPLSWGQCWELHQLGGRILW